MPGGNRRAGDGDAHDSPELSRGEWAVLALLAERPAHGWALSRQLQPDSELGQIWAGDRTRVYRALRKLEESGLIEPALTESRDGPTRTIYRPTQAGAARLEGWLDEPVEHLRDINSTFLLKLAFAQRAGLDPTHLLAAQRATVVGAIAQIANRLIDTSPVQQIHLRLRLETARAVLGFIDGLTEARASLTSPVSGKRRRAASGGRAPLDIGPRRTGPAPGGVTSDFSGAPIANDGQTATVIVRFNDGSHSIVVATARLDDEIVADVVQAGQQVERTRSADHG